MNERELAAILMSISIVAKNAAKKIAGTGRGKDASSRYRRQGRYKKCQIRKQ